MMNLGLIEVCSDGQPAVAAPLCDVSKSVCEATAALYQRSGYVPPWIGYLVEREGVIVGTCAFKTPPQAGEVEIAYFTFPEYEGRGIATEMARRLIEIAHAADSQLTITAQTLPQENASTRILRRLGFQQTGMAHDADVGEVWAWERKAE